MEVPYIKLISVQKYETLIPDKFLSSPVLRSLIELLALEGKISLSSSESNSPYFFLSTNMGCIFKVSLESKFQNYNWNRHLWLQTRFIHIIVYHLTLGHMTYEVVWMYCSKPLLPSWQIKRLWLLAVKEKQQRWGPSW